MGDIPGTYDAIRERRERYLRYTILSLLVIIAGLLSLLTVNVWKIVLIMLILPTFIGGYSLGNYVRDLVVESLTDRGFEPEDAEIYALTGGILGGILGSLILAGMQALFVLMMLSMGTII